MSVNFGTSTKLQYDTCAYADRLSESESPLSYKLNPIKITHPNHCLSTLGPRGKYGISLPTDIDGTVLSQQLVDVESLLSNRNVKTSKCKTGNVNAFDINDYKLQNPRLCDNHLTPTYTRLTMPSASFRDIPINRFYDIDRNPQQALFWNFSVNSKLEAKDNFKMNKTMPKTFDPSLGRNVASHKFCPVNCDKNCPSNCAPIK